jgi:hypothetical protein
MSSQISRMSSARRIPIKTKSDSGVSLFVTQILTKTNRLLSVLLQTTIPSIWYYLPHDPVTERCSCVLLQTQKSAIPWMSTMHLPYRVWTNSSTLSNFPSTTTTSLHLSIRISRLPIVMPRLLPPLLASTTIVETTSAETSTTLWLRKRKIQILLCCHLSDHCPDLHHTDLLPSSSTLS